MSYVDGIVCSVPTDQKEAYLTHAKIAAQVFKEYGAIRSVDAWGDDVPEGKVTDFHRAVQAKPGETIVLGWIEWPDKATRDAGMAKAMTDERLTNLNMPFDGQRAIFGGFQSLYEG